ncbi:hypothetical protein CAFE_11320 [Caprobacter fermentans]|uniref:Flp pilus assembly protein TadB n=1 Tax=Caproicibacter fermentans TaxID=2576756 RepID=A0A6N8HYN6_9FIRM|nr:hypothetical protein [Caproicibacter fermentans]MVB10443.1 hypothetical protein [Caproicibacter fermentans]
MIFYIASFFAMIAGIFVVFQIQPAECIKAIKTSFEKLNRNRKTTLKQQIKQLKKKEPRGIVRILRESRSILEVTHRTDRLPVYTFSSILLFFCGCVISLLLQNYFLLPVLAVGSALIPWLVILATASKFKRQLNSELETALGMITTSYLRCDNILVAVRENIPELQFPVKEVFEKFSVQASLISSDIPALLEEMKKNIDNDTFKDWIDQLILCQGNRTLKSTLQPIVTRFSEVREVSGDLDSLLYEPLKEFVAMAALTILNYPLFRAISMEWYNTLMYTFWGQIIMTVTFVVLFVSLTAVIKNTRAVEYKR